MGSYIKNEEKINELFAKIEIVDNDRKALINELISYQDKLINMTNKKNSYLLVYAFLLVLLAIILEAVFHFVGISLITLVGGVGLGIRIRKLLEKKEKPYKENIKKINKKIESKKCEKVNLNKELSKYITNENKEEIIKEIDKRLEEIRQEKIELNNIRSLMDSEANLIDITNVYVVEINNIKYLAYLENPTNRLYGFKDVFSGEKIWSGIGENLYNAINRSYNKPLGVTKLKDYETAILAYPNNLVPDYVLKQIYYNLNNVDLNAPVLKKEVH